MPDDDARAPLDADELRRLLLEPDGPLTRVEVVGSTGSTNSDVVAALRADPTSWPDGGVLVAHHQTGGRGRAGRDWQTPAGTSLTCSFVVRPVEPADRWGWLPLLAGLGAVTAVRATAGVPAVLKWPNDVLVPASAGVPAAVVVGIGLNVSQTADELPVPTASSLALAGARHVDRLGLLVALVSALDEVAGRWQAAAGDARASGLADEVVAVCATLGTRVEVDQPGGAAVVGLASGLDDDGALLVLDDAGQTRRVLAGDVRHVRAAG